MNGLHIERSCRRMPITRMILLVCATRAHATCTHACAITGIQIVGPTKCICSQRHHTSVPYTTGLYKLQTWTCWLKKGCTRYRTSKGSFARLRHPMSHERVISGQTGLWSYAISARVCRLHSKIAGRAKIVAAQQAKE